MTISIKTTSLKLVAAILLALVINTPAFADQPALTAPQSQPGNNQITVQQMRPGCAMMMAFMSGFNQMMVANQIAMQQQWAYRNQWQLAMQQRQPSIQQQQLTSMEAVNEES